MQIRTDLSLNNAKYQVQWKCFGIDSICNGEEDAFYPNVCDAYCFDTLKLFSEIVQGHAAGRREAANKGI